MNTHYQFLKYFGKDFQIKVFKSHLDGQEHVALVLGDQETFLGGDVHP